VEDRKEECFSTIIDASSGKGREVVELLGFDIVPRDHDGEEMSSISGQSRGSSCFVLA